MWPWEFSTINFSNNVSIKDFDKAFKLCNDHDVLVHPKTLKEHMCNKIKSKYENKHNFKYDIVFVSFLYHTKLNTFRLRKSFLLFYLHI